VVVALVLVAELCLFSFLFAQTRQPLAGSFVFVLPRETVFGIVHAGVIVVAIVEIAGRLAVILDFGDRSLVLLLVAETPLLLPVGDVG